MAKMSDEQPRGGRTLILSDRAASELAETIGWYEHEKAGLGLEFLAAVDTVLALLLENPGVGMEVRPRVRRTLLRRFPYGLFYTNQQDRIRVLAILHSHRHPARWPRRA